MGEIHETWTSRELPILRVALRHYEAGERPVSLELIRAETGLSADQVTIGAEALAVADPPYLEVAFGAREVGSSARDRDTSDLRPHRPISLSAGRPAETGGEGGPGWIRTSDRRIMSPLL